MKLRTTLYELVKSDELTSDGIYKYNNDNIVATAQELDISFYELDVKHTGEFGYMHTDTVTLFSTYGDAIRIATQLPLAKKKIPDTICGWIITKRVFDFKVKEIR